VWCYGEMPGVHAIRANCLPQIRHLPRSRPQRDLAALPVLLGFDTGRRMVMTPGWADQVLGSNLRGYGSVYDVFENITVALQLDNSSFEGNRRGVGPVIGVQFGQNVLDPAFD